MVCWLKSCILIYKIMNKDEKKVILFALPDFRGGGAERVFLNLINNISSDLFEVHVAVGKFQGAYHKDLSDQVYLHELGSIKFINSIFPMARLIWHIKPNIVLSTLGYVVSSSLVSLFSPKKVVFVSRFGNTASSFLEEIKKNSKIRYYLQYILNKSVFYLSDLVIVQSNHMSQDLTSTFKLKDKYLRKVIQINNPVAFEAINLSAKLDVFSKDFNKIFKNNFVFVSVGRLESRKNYKSLLIAFKSVNQIYPETRLIILGEGESRPYLESFIAKNEIDDFVKLPGFIANPGAIVSKSDFFISSSLYEGVSNAILESLALGIPVIATDCPSGIKDVITDGENGYLVNINGDIIKNLSEKMLFVVSENNNNNFLKISQKILEDFDINVIVKKYESILLQLLSRKK